LDVALTGKEEAVANLTDFHRVAGEIGLSYCLMDGTLLGALRDGDFCENDWDDIDIGILSKDYDRTGILIRAMAPLGFTVFKTLFYKSAVCREGRIEGIGLIRGTSHFDLIRVCHHPTRPECYNLGSGPKGHMAFVYPDKHYATFGTVEFYGMTFRTPADPEGFLTARYGDWRTEIRRPAFQWYEQSNRASIRDDYDILIPT
jgi:hypothetical protein